jgi:hypothetical protein
MKACGDPAVRPVPDDDRDLRPTQQADRIDLRNFLPGKLARDSDREALEEREDLIAQGCGLDPAAGLARRGQHHIFD